MRHHGEGRRQPFRFVQQTKRVGSGGLGPDSRLVAIVVARNREQAIKLFCHTQRRSDD